MLFPKIETGETSSENREPQFCPVFTGVKATAEVAKDMLTFKQVGQELFEDHVKCNITGESR